MHDLSRDDKIILAKMYKAYLERRKQGTSKTDARNFRDSEIVRDELCREFSYREVFETCVRLGNKGFLDVWCADNKTYRLLLQEKTIAYMDNRFKDGIKAVVKFIAEIAL